MQCRSEFYCLAFQLKIVRVDPFKNGSCYSEDKLEASSIYRKYKGSTYSVQVCLSCLDLSICHFGFI